MSYQIRRARTDDLDDVMEFCRRIWRERDYSEKTWPSWIGNPRRAMLVVANEGTVCGIVRGEMISAGEGWVEGVRIDPAHKSRGLGSLLLEAMIPVLRGKGAESIRSLIACDNLASQRVFEKNAFCSPFLHRPFKIKRRMKRIVSGRPSQHLARINKKDGPLATGLLERERNCLTRRSYLRATNGLYCCDGVHWRTWNEAVFQGHLEAGEVWMWADPTPQAIAVVTSSPVRPGVFDVGLLEGSRQACRSLLGELAIRKAAPQRNGDYPPSVRTFFPVELRGLQRAACQAGFTSDRVRHKAMFLYEWRADRV